MSRVDDIIKRMKNGNSSEEDTQSGSRVDRLIKKVKVSASTPDSSYLDSFLSDYSKFSESAANDYKGIGFNNATSLYENYSKSSTDLRLRLNELMAMYNLNSENLSEEQQKLKNYLTQAKYGIADIDDAYYKTSHAYSQFESEDDYNKYKIGWLYDDAETNEQTVAQRQERYKNNEKRISEIKELLPWIGDTFLPSAIENIFLSDENEKLKAEMEALEAENNKYDRTQGVTDRYYIPITDEITQIASNRNYTNATRDELDAYDASVSDGSLALNSGGRYDEEGNILDSNGNIVMYANAPEVQDKLGMFLSAVEDGTYMDYVGELSANGPLSNVWGELMQEGDVNGWKYLEPDEITNYYYRLANEGQESAYKYLEAMSPILTRRETQKRADEIAEASTLEKIAYNAASIPMSLVGGAVGLVDDASKVLQGKETDPYSRGHLLSNDASEIRESTAEDIDNWTGGAEIPWVGTSFGDVYQYIMSAGDSAMASFIPGGHYLLGLNAASSEMKELYDRGASTDQMLAGGILAGVTEAFFEKYSIGEIKKLKNMDKKAVKGLTDWFVRTAIMGGVEASEEMATEIANTLSDALVMGSQTDWVDFNTFAKNVVNAGIGGLVSGGLMGGFAAKINNSMYNKQIKTHGQEIIDQGGTETLKNLALEMYGKQSDIKGSVGVNLASRVGAKASAKNVGRLSDFMEDTITSKNEATLRKALAEQGLSSKVAEKVAKYITDSSELSKEDIKTIEGSKRIQSIIDNVLADSNIDISDASLQLMLARVGETNKRLYDIALEKAGVREATEQNAVTKSKADFENATGAKFKASKSGKTKYENADVTIGKVVSTDGGLKVELDNGKTVNASDVEFGSGAEAMMYEMVARMEVPVDTANEILNAYKPTTAKQAAMYFHNVPLAYKYGTINHEAGLRNINMSESEKRLAFTRGKKDAERKAESNTKTASPNSEKTAPTKKNGIIFEEGVNYDESTANELQKASMIGIETIAQMSSLEVHVFESVVENGERVFYLNGERQPAPNGYFKDGNKIYIDLNAGNGGEGVMLYTMSHEVTHYIRKWNEKGFKELADFLIEQYGKNKVSVTYLIEKQKEKIEKRYKNDGKALPSDAKLFDMAYEELVADAMSDMFADPLAYEKLAKLKQQNKTLWQKFGEAIKAVLDKLKSALGIYKTEQDKIAVAQEAHEVRAFSKEVYEKLQDLYIKAFVEADANYEASNDGKEVISECNEKLSERGVAEDGKKIYESNFPKGTLKSAKSQRILEYIKNVWSKKPISLVISNGETSRTILAQFDPTVDEGQNTPTDASKIAGGNRHGNHTEQRVTLDLADDYYQIASEATYNYSKLETGKDSETHNDVKMWHYFVNDIYFAEYGEEALTPYTVTVNVKEKDSGDFVYSFNAEKESSTQRTLHAAVNTYKGANGELFLGDSIPQNTNSVNRQNSDSEEKYSDRDDFNQAKSNLQKKYKIDANDVLALADKYLGNYTVSSSKTNIRLQFLRVAEPLAEIFTTGNTDLLQEATNRAEVLASDIEQARSTGTDQDLVAIKNYLRKTNIQIPTFYKAEFDRFGGLNEFRKKHMGKFILSKNGIQVDVLYPELQGLFGTVWFPDIDTVPDQLMRIAEVTDASTESIIATDYDMDAAIEYTREEIMSELSNLVMKSIDKQSRIHIDYRDPNAVSNRTLLANALESTVQNDIEKTKLNQYKNKIALIESEQKKLAEIRAKANEIRFTKGRTPAETKTMRDLDAEANQIANRISAYDKQLLNLESTTALKNVLEREKTMLRKKLDQKGKEALRAQKEKNAKTVKELMTRYQESRTKAIEGRHKTEMRHKIKNVVSDLNKLLLNPTKEQHVPIGLQLPVAEALDAINMDTMNAGERVAYYNDLIAKSSDPDEIAMLTKKRDFFEYRDANFKERITALKNAYAEFKESDDPLIRNAHNEAIEDLIKNTADAVGNKSLKDMSLAQLEAVYNMYKAILATVRNSNKMFKEGRQETVTDNSEAVKNEVREVGGHKDRVLKVTKFLKKFGWNMLKPITAMKVVGSKTFEKLFDNVRAAEDTWAVDVSEAKDFYDNASAKYGFKKWDFKKRYSFKDSAGTDFSLSLEQIMSLYAYSKRDQADRHLEDGGFIFDDAIEVTEKKFGIPLKYEVNDANPYRLRKEDLIAVTDALTQEQKAFIDEMQTYLSEVMGEKGNEVSLAMYDIKLYNEKNYFPLKTSRYFREFDPEKSGTPKIKNSGFSKKTVPRAGNPIVLSNFMDVWASHVNDMSMYHAFVLPLEDFLRVYNYSSTAGGYDSVQQYIKNAYGAQANQYIEKLMDDLNGGARVDSSADIINKGLSLFKKASTFASASVVVQQPSAIARALAYINPKYFVTSAPSALNLAKHKTLWAEVKKYAPVAVIKEMGYFDTGVGRSTVEWLKGNQTVKDKMDDVLSKAPAIADELSWCYIWEAVKKETAAKNQFKVGSEEFLKECGRRFTEVITNTQVYDSTLSRSGMMRSKDTGMKMATAFMAEPTTTVNMMVDGIIQGKRGNKKFTAATVGAISASIILNSILVALVYAARDDDDDETYTEKYIGSLTSELLDGFNALTYIPLIKDAWSIAQGYDVERSDMSVVSKLWESVEGLFDENKSGWEKVTDATGAVSSLFGIPLKNLIRDAKGMYNLTKTILGDASTTKAGIAESVEDSFKSSIPLWDRLTESKNNADRLYEAIMSGDQTQIDRIKGRYKDDKAVESAMRQALREHDSRINEAAQARLDGDISAYTRIAKEIIGEGYFSQDTVVGAINTEMTAIKKGESSGEESTEDKDEATSIYKASDVNVALDNGDTDLALQIIDDLIETKVANGMEEKNVKSSVRSSMTSYWKPLYKQAYQSGDTTEMTRIRRILLSSGLYGTSNDVVKTVKNWLKS